MELGLRHVAILVALIGGFLFAGALLTSTAAHAGDGAVTRAGGARTAVEPVEPVAAAVSASSADAPAQDDADRPDGAEPGLDAVPSDGEPTRTDPAGQMDAPPFSPSDPAAGGEPVTEAASPVTEDVTRGDAPMENSDPATQSPLGDGGSPPGTGDGTPPVDSATEGAEPRDGTVAVPDGGVVQIDLGADGTATGEAPTVPTVPSDVADPSSSPAPAVATPAPADHLGERNLRTAISAQPAERPRSPQPRSVEPGLLAGGVDEPRPDPAVAVPGSLADPVPDTDRLLTPDLKQRSVSGLGAVSSDGEPDPVSTLDSIPVTPAPTLPPGGSGGSPGSSAVSGGIGGVVAVVPTAEIMAGPSFVLHVPHGPSGQASWRVLSIAERPG